MGRGKEAEMESGRVGKRETDSERDRESKRSLGRETDRERERDCRKGEGYEEGGSQKRTLTIPRRSYLKISSGLIELNAESFEHNESFFVFWLGESGG